MACSKNNKCANEYRHCSNLLLWIDSSSAHTVEVLHRESGKNVWFRGKHGFRLEGIFFLRNCRAESMVITINAENIENDLSPSSMYSIDAQRVLGPTNFVFIFGTKNPRCSFLNISPMRLCFLICRINNLIYYLQPIFSVSPGYASHNSYITCLKSSTNK